MNECMNCVNDCYNEPKVRLAFTYVDEDGTATSLDKVVNSNYLDEPNELAVVNRVYQEFLTACGFAVNSDDVVVVLSGEEAYELGL